jgi:HEAT repeat protein
MPLLLFCCTKRLLKTTHPVKKYLYSTILFCLFLTSGIAQQSNPTTATRITDLLAQMPAKDAKAYARNAGEMAALGKDGIVQLISRLSPTGKGDNSAIEYAVGGFTYFVTQPGKEEWRQLAVDAYTEALPKLTDKTNQAFILFQLQQVAKDKAVPTLTAFLDNAELAGPAARALAKVGTPAAGQALLTALEKPWGDNHLSFMEALGDMQYQASAPVIERYATSNEQATRKVAHYALAQIAAPSSESILFNAAQKAGLIYDESNATAYYLRYLTRLLENGDTKTVAKAAQTLMAKAGASHQVAIRTAALKLLTDAQSPAMRVATLVNAAGSSDAEYRAAALKYLQPLAGTATTALLLKSLAKGSPEVKADIIAYFGRTNAKEALPVVLQLISSKDKAVQLAAISAAGKVGGEAVFTKMVPLLKSTDAATISAAKTAVLTMKGNSVVDQVALAIPSLSSAGKVAMVEVLAARRADAKMGTITNLLKSTDADVKTAAYSALKSVATAQDIPQLFTLLNAAATPTETESVQEAIKATIKGKGTVAQQTDLLLSEMASSGKKAAYLPILASVGGKRALDAVVAAFNGDDAASQKAALASLANWSDQDAAKELYKIGTTTTNADYLDAAVQGYVKSISKSSATPVQKVLQLRKALDIAKTAEQKTAILKELQRNKTFESLLVAGRYLDDRPVQQAAAQAVMGIALANPEFTGSVVTDLLTKTMNVLAGRDSEYQKEAIKKHLSELPKGDGFVALFNGKDLTGWKGLVENPIKRAAMHPDTLAAKQAKADARMRTGWVVKNGELVFTGHGDNLATVKKYGDFEMYVDWKIEPEGDAGIYLRGTPQVQIWDTSRVSVGAQVGSGGLYNNQKHPSKPTQVADNAVGEWNTFYIKMIGDRVTVDLNGVRVVDNVILENYWDRKLPIFPTEQLELQAHGTQVYYRDIYVKELPRPEPFALSEEEKKEGFKVLFDGTNMHEWTGNTQDYIIENGAIVTYPTGRGNGNLYTKDQYADFNFRFEFQLTPGANNGLGIRAPLTGDAAYVGLAELQILDDTAPIYAKLQPYQYHGSVYGMIPARRGHLKPVGEWNYEEVILQGNKIKVILNGTTIVDGDIAEATKNGTADHKDHPGLKNEIGHIGFLGHGTVVKFRNIRVKDLAVKEAAPAPVEATTSKKKRKK